MTEKKEKGAGRSIPDIAANIYELLEKLDGAERTRALNGALAMLGDAPLTSVAPHSHKDSASREDGGSAGLHTRAIPFLRRHGITTDHLERVFQIDNGQVEVIAAAPKNSSNRASTHAAYQLAGLAAFLGSGEAKFHQQSALTLMKHWGCYDTTNNTTYRRAMGNQITGSKKNWLLTAPGLDAAAKLVKELAGGD